MENRAPALQGMSKAREWMVRLSICCAGYGLFSDNVVIPLVNALMNDFPDASTSLLNFVISGNAIAGMAAGLITGFLLKKVRRKPLLIIGTITFVIGGVGGVFAKDLVSLGILRAIDSASDGILTVTTAAMIVELWRSEKEQGFLFGLYNSISGIFGCLASVVAGYAALTDWHNAFWCNTFGIPPVILCIIFVPDVGPLNEGSNELPEELWEQKLRWRPMVFVLAMLAINLLQSISYMIVTLSDVFIAEQGIGNSVVTGYMGVVPVVFGTLGNLTAAPVLAKFKNKRLFVVLFGVAMAITFWLFSGCHSIPMLVVCMILNVLSQTWMVVYYDVYTARSVPRKQRTVCLGILTQSVYVDTVLCIYIPVFTEKLFGTVNIAQCCGVCAAAVACVTIIYLVLAFAVKRDDYAYA